MHRRHQHGVATASWAWPQQPSRHAGLLDIGMFGGGYLTPSTGSLLFAKDNHDFVYSNRSPLTQMLPRVRPWVPRPVESWPQETMFSKPIEARLNTGLSHLRAAYTEDWFPEDLVFDTVKEEGYRDYRLEYNDPFIGNVCAVGSFINLPVVATPAGPTGADLDIILIHHKPNQEPPFNMLAPKSALITFPSPICQIATPPPRAGIELDEQFLVRTRGHVSIVAAPTDIPDAISRIEPEYVKIVDRIPSRPLACKDHTIHAAISPHIPNTYALMGDKGRVALWSRHTGSLENKDESDLTIIRSDDLSPEEDLDPWRRCAWGPHPRLLAVASRKKMELLDFRARATSTALFTPRARESIQAIQEDGPLNLAPFQTYIATSHQVACIDQRFAKAPLISWAHQGSRSWPCGLVAMDLATDQGNYTTVLTWEKRNAEIISYNISLGSNDTQPTPLTMEGSAQELPSFHSHSQYTGSSALRNPLKVWHVHNTQDGQLQQSTKPPLQGFGVIATSLLEAHDDGDSVHDVKASHLSISRFSILQYSATGAVYAQEVEMMPKEQGDQYADVVHDPQSTLRTGEADVASGNPLTSKLARDLVSGQELDEMQVIDELIAAAEQNVASWKSKIKEAQELADDVVVSREEIHEHVELDMREMLVRAKRYLLFDWEKPHLDMTTGAAAKAEEGMRFIATSCTPPSMFDVLQAIGCSGLSMVERDAIAGLIRQDIEQDPFLTTKDEQILHRKVIRTWPILNLKVGTLLRDEQPSVDDITAFLEEMYPLPQRQALRRSRAEESITSRFASLNIPANSTDINEPNDGPASGSLLSVNQDEEESNQEVWPAAEAHQMRQTTVRRLAQELVLSTTVIVTTVLPAIESEPEPIKRTERIPKFQHLFQNLGPNRPGPPRIDLSSRCKSILDEWKVGTDPYDYKYVLPDGTSGGQDEDEVENEEEKREREERLLRLRQRREKRSNKYTAARNNDAGYNISAGGSASQPVGVVVSELETNPSGIADDDGHFSLPTVVSASQPAFIRSTAVAVGSRSGTGVEATRTALQIKSTSFSASVAPIIEYSGSQSLSQDQLPSQSQEDSALLWGASQPVRGPFANRKIAKPKKAKARVQGF
ncbi:TATA box-binding protein-associated factor RNA polymerase I subunit C [Mortierella alpina]|nr:TATA box-binding protein-associated factor RNA polymerase I subunit C [Mortierella alpina]